MEKSSKTLDLQKPLVSILENSKIYSVAPHQ